MPKRKRSLRCNWVKIMRKVVQSSKPFFALLFSIVIAMMAISPPIAYATEESNESKHYLGTVVNAGHDTGFSENNAISENDPHFGWKLGEFYVNGYTRVTEDKNGTPVFLKTVGDTVTLWFKLEQDITKLNGGETLSINDDANGHDEYFGIEKTDMGRGTLIIRHTDYQNHAGDPVIYTVRKEIMRLLWIMSCVKTISMCSVGIRFHHTMTTGFSSAFLSAMVIVWFIHLMLLQEPN